VKIVPPVRSLAASLGPGRVAVAEIVRLDAPLPESPTWAELVPRERAFAEAASPRRAREFTAGRAAVRRALTAAGATPDEVAHACLPEERGGPRAPEGWTASITHKAGWAVAVVGRRDLGTLGVDAEVLGRERPAIASRVLRPEELERWRREGARWPDLLRAFSVKEAVYKALHPWVPRYIGFHEAEIDPDGSIRMHLQPGEGAYAFTSTVEVDGDRLLSFVRVRPARQ